MIPDQIYLDPDRICSLVAVEVDAARVDLHLSFLAPPIGQLHLRRKWGRRGSREGQNTLRHHGSRRKEGCL